MDEYIRFDNVDFRFSASGHYSNLILRGFDLAIKKCEFHVLLGPSGCGKTTALNLVAGFEFPTSGEVRVDGRKVSRPGVDRVVIFQGDDSLYRWLTALENVEFGLRVAGVPAATRRGEALKYLELVGLKGQEGKFPSQLSGGMKQRVQLARALACHTDILLMDEPFGALDAQTRSILQSELSDIWARTSGTVLFVTHDISEAILLADRISIMTGGPEARLKETLAVPLQRPRSIAHPEFGRIYEEISCLLGLYPATGLSRSQQITDTVK